MSYLTDQIQSFIKKEKPFAIVQSYESWIMEKDNTWKIYDLMYITHNFKPKIIGLSKDEANYILRNNSVIKEVLKNEDGCVYEFNNYKAYHKKHAKSDKKTNKVKP